MFNINLIILIILILKIIFILIFSKINYSVIIFGILGNFILCSLIVLLNLNTISLVNLLLFIPIVSSVDLLLI